MSPVSKLYTETKLVRSQLRSRRLDVGRARVINQTLLIDLRSVGMEMQYASLRKEIPDVAFFGPRKVRRPAK